VSQTADTLDGPVVQSLRTGFGVLYFATLLLALGWAGSNIRQVPPESQAVVLRFGRVVRVEPPGLMLALPRPIEQVELLPAPARQMELKVVARTAGGPGVGRRPESLPPTSAGGYLTGDGGQVLLDAGLTWRIVDPVAYYVARDHVPAALRRLFIAGAGAVAAGRSMDEFLVVRPERDAADPMVEAQRAALRGDLVAEVNRRLHALEGQGAPLGVEVTRADVDVLLPPLAKPGFDAVLEAAQLAEERLASARTDATRTLQAADREHDAVLAAAQAAAAERVGEARAQVAAITALEAGKSPATRPGLLDQIWRERIATVLRQAGSVTTVDAQTGNRLILPAARP